MLNVENHERIRRYERLYYDRKRSCLNGRISLLIKSTRATSKKNRLNFDLTKEYLLSLWKTQNGMCALTGLQLTFDKVTEFCDKTSTLISIDRKDSNLGYEKDNVQFVCYFINILKRRWDNEELIDICKLIVDHSKRRGN